MESGDTLSTEYKRDKLNSDDFYFAVRPEKISINSGNKDNVIKGKVKTVLPSGSETVMQVEVGKDMFNILMQQEVEYTPGESVDLHIPAGSILLYDKDEKLIAG